MHNPFKSIQPAGETKDALASTLTAANTWFQEQKEEAFQNVINLKETEVALLAKMSAPSAQTAALRDTLDADWDVTVRNINQGVEPAKDADGNDIPPASAIPQIIEDDLARCKELAPHWVAKIWEFTRGKSQTAIDTLKAKKEGLAAKADVEMAEAPNMDQLAESAVVNALKKMGIKASDVGQVCSLNTLSSHNHTTNSTLGKRKTACPPEDDQHRPSHWQQPAAKRPRTQTQTQGVRECTAHYEFPKKECKWCQLRARQEVESQQIVLHSKWNPTKPSSIPRQILDLPTDKAVSLIQSRMHLSQIVDADFKVKLGPGVLSIPENIDNLLCMGHRFLFPSVFNIVLPLEYYASLARRVKWIVYFSYMGKQSTFLDENPQFTIRKNESTEEPQHTPRWVSDLVEKGRLEMHRQIQAIPSTAIAAPVNPNYKRELAALRNWRKHNDLLVLQSDKNLGTTVVSS